jgi:shikimate kinase
VRVALTGFMGAGKTATGRALARRLDIPFHDLDDEIERAAERTVAALFEEEGEAGFRRREHAALARLLQTSGTFGRDRFVLATGGGTMAQADSAELLLEGTRTVWLRVSFELVLARLGGEEAARRPLFRDPAAARALYERRRPSYARCEVVLDVGAGETPDEVAARLERRLRQGPGR